MKKIKQASKILLTVVCILTTILTYNTDNLSTVHAANTTTRGEWMHTLVETFDMTIEDGIVPDDYYGDISSSEYYEDILIAMNFGVIDLEPGEDFEPDNAVTREFAAQTLNYCLGFQLDENASYTMSDKVDLTYPDDAQIAINRNWFALIDGKFSPDTAMTLSEKNTMLADAKEVWASTEVDPNYENSYTFADDVIEVPDGTDVVLNEDGSVTIIDCPVAITKNDSFAVYLNGVAQIYKAVSVTKNGQNLTIAVQELDFDEAVEDVDAQGEIEADLTEAVPLTEGVTITYEEDSAGVSTYGLFSGNTKNVKPITVNANVSGVQLTCKIENIKVEYINKIGEKYIAVKGKGSFTASTKQKKNLIIPLVEVPVAGVGKVFVNAEYSMTGSVSLTYTTNFVVGVSYTKAGGYRLVKEFSKGTFSYSAKVDASAGYRIGLDVGMPGFAYGLIYGDVGIKGIADLEGYTDGKKPATCLDLAAFLYVRVGYDFSFFGLKSWNDSYSIYGYNNSPIRICYHIEDGVEVASCTRGKTTSSGKKSKYYTPWHSETGVGGSGGRTTISSYCDWGLIADNTVAIYEYTLDEDNNATITKYNGMAYCLVIPDTIDGYTVTAIGSSAFKNNAYIYSAVTPDTVTNIGNSAFNECSNLQQIDISDNVSQIGISAFRGCVSLTAVTLPKSLVTIGENAFADCANVKSVWIPKALDRVYATYDSVYQPTGVFSGCSNLTTVEFEEGVTEIPYYIFSYCEGIRKIKIPDTVTTIERGAFYKCVNLEELYMPNTITEIGISAFSGCILLKEAKLPKGLVTIGENAFADCANVKSVWIPKALDRVYATYDSVYQPTGVFNGCSNLETVEFEEGVTEIPYYIFSYCEGIREITIPNTVTSIEWGAFYNCINLEKVNMSNSVTEIGLLAFYGCTSLQNISLPNSLLQMGEEVFAYCSNLESVWIPKSLNKIYDRWDSLYEPSGVFNHCSGLKTIIFEEGIKTIPSYLFGSCSGLEKLTIPNTITEIGNGVFRNCENLQQVSMPNSVTVINNSVFQNCTSLAEVDIPNSVTSMGTSVFSGCTSLEKVHIPNNSVNIPNAMFYDCTSLTEVNLPDTLQTIGSSAFYNCTSLTEINLPEKVNTINASAFSGCTALTKVTIPESMQKIYGSAFSHCEALTDLTIAEGTTEIGTNAFEYCKALKTVTLPDSLQTLGSYAFRYCDVLSEVNIGAGLKVIPSYCFYEDPALQKVILPQQVTTVNQYAFGNCTKFTDITMNRNVTSVALNAFSYPGNLTIHGISGTYPQTFATENNITFVPLDAPATALKLNKSECQVARGYTLQLTANITPADSSDELTWTSTDEDIVTVDASGLIKGIKTGTATILAMAGDVIETCEVTVYEKVTSVSLNTTSKELSIGDTLQITATVYPTNATNKNISWSTSDETVATVDNNGLVTAIAYGTAAITVTTEDGGYTRTCTVTVKPIAVTGVTLNAKTVVVGVGSTYQLVPTISPENASVKEVTWTSSNPSVATVEDGLVTGVSEGTAVIIVKTQDEAKTASCTITVKNLSVTGVTLDKTELEMETRTTYQLTETIEPLEAGNKAVTWTSDNEDVATVNNGKITAKKAGTAHITVTTDDGGFTASCTVTVIGHSVTGVTLSKESISMEVGNCALLEAVVTPENADDKSVTWESSDEQVVTVDNETGVLAAVSAGTATITVITTDGNYEAVCEVTVTEVGNPDDIIHVTGVTVIPTDESIAEENTVEVGEAFTLDAVIEPQNASNKNVIWLSSNKEIAMITQEGIVTTKGVGEVTFTAISEEGGKQGQYTISVVPVKVTGVTLSMEELEINIGEKKVLQAIVMPENATNQNVAWSSSMTSVATVSQTGQVTAIRVGTTVITVTTEDGEFTASCAVTVKPVLVSSITLNVAQTSLYIGGKVSLIANLLPANATDKGIEWTSDNTGIAAVDETGSVTAIAEGSATITATAADGSGVTGTCVIIVNKKQTTTPELPEQPPVPEQPPTGHEPTDNDIGGQGQSEGETGTQSALPAVGKEYTVSSGTYKVTQSSSTNKEVTFTKLKNSKKTTVTIPATIEIDGQTYKVTEIAPKAFKNNKKLKSVTIGKNVNKIGKEAFSECTKLKKITIKSTVLKSVGKNAIKGIDKKATIKCPKKQLAKYKKLFRSKTGYKKSMTIKK